MNPMKAAERLESMGIEHAVWPVVALTRFATGTQGIISGARAAAAIVAGLRIPFAVALLDRAGPEVTTRILNECPVPGKAAELVLAMTRTNAKAALLSPFLDRCWWWTVVTVDMDATTAIAFLMDINVYEPITFILGKLDPTAATSIVLNLPEQQLNKVYSEIGRYGHDDALRRLSVMIRKKVRANRRSRW